MSTASTNVVGVDMYTFQKIPQFKPGLRIVIGRVAYEYVHTSFKLLRSNGQEIGYDYNGDGDPEVIDPQYGGSGYKHHIEQDIPANSYFWIRAVSPADGYVGS